MSEAGHQRTASESARRPRPRGVDLLDLDRRLRRLARRRRRRAGHPVVDAGDVYTIVLGAVIVLALAAGAVMRHGGRVPLTAEAGTAAPVSHLPWGASWLASWDLSWAATAAVLVLAAWACGPVSRLGPVILWPEQADWLLPLPAARGRLLRRAATRVLLIAVCLAAFTGALTSVALGVLGPAVLSWTMVGAMAAAVVVLALTRAQAAEQVHHHQNPRTGGVRAVLLVVAVVCLVLARAPGALGISSAWAPALTALLGAACALVLWVTTTTARFESLTDTALRTTGARAAGARALGVQLDTRSLGLLLGPPVSPPRRHHRLPLHRMAAWDARLRTLAGVGAADWLLLQRQPWRPLLILVGGVLAGALTGVLMGLPVLSPDSAVGRTVSHTVALLAVPMLGWGAAHVCADPARRAWADEGPDGLWPAGPVWVRAGHLLAPMVLMACWAGACATMAGILMLGAGAGAAQVGSLVAVLALSVPGWAGACLRSGFRREADWTLLVPTPVGTIPADLLRQLYAGPDLALVVGAPVVLLMSGAGAGAMVLAQVVASALALVCGLRAGGADEPAGR